MRFLVTLLLAFALALLARQFMPWWGAVVGAAAAAWIQPAPRGRSWIAGFLGVFFLWAGVSWVAHAGNQGILGERMAGMFGLSSPILLLFAGAVLGGIGGALGAWTGARLHSLTSRRG